MPKRDVHTRRKRFLSAKIMQRKRSTKEIGTKKTFCTIPAKSFSLT
jgi:hypothetical protein